MNTSQVAAHLLDEHGISLDVDDPDDSHEVRAAILDRLKDIGDQPLGEATPPERYALLQALEEVDRGGGAELVPVPKAVLDRLIEASRPSPAQAERLLRAEVDAGLARQRTRSRRVVIPLGSVSAILGFLLTAPSTIQDLPLWGLDETGRFSGLIHIEAPPKGQIATWLAFPFLLALVVWICAWSAARRVSEWTEDAYDSRTIETTLRRTVERNGTSFTREEYGESLPEVPDPHISPLSAMVVAVGGPRRYGSRGLVVSDVEKVKDGAIDAGLSHLEALGWIRSYRRSDFNTGYQVVEMTVGQ